MTEHSLGFVHISDQELESFGSWQMCPVIYAPSTHTHRSTHVRAHACAT